MTRHNEWFLMYSPDEQYVKRTLADLVSQTSLLGVPQAFPHISAHRYEHPWQQQWGLSVSQGHPCIFRVMGNQYRRRIKPLAQGRPLGYDHPSLWLWPGQVLCDLTQPYHSETADLQALRACAEAHDFTRNLWGYGAWHSPGHALRVAWWQTSLRAAFLNQSVQIPHLAYEQKVTERHRIVHSGGVASVAGVAVPSPPVISRASSAPPRLHQVGMVGVADVGGPGGRQTRAESARALGKSAPETNLILEGYPGQQGTTHSLTARETNNDHSLKETEDIWLPICTTAA
jgi:hypothetical protein